MLSINNKRILNIALPSIISNITVPLLGLVDVSIVGHLGSASYIGAIAVGGMLFNIIYWIFGFLRMGTSGLTSQALGKRNFDEVSQLLIRAVGIGLIISVCLIILQKPIEASAFYFLDSSQEIEQYASQYFRICIWGAPAVLGLYGFSGWFIGMQNSRIPMMIAITQNIINISFSLFFVFALNLKIEGVALGTLISQYSGFLMAYILWKTSYKKHKKVTKIKEAFRSSDMLSFFKVNKDIFLRTVCLVSVTVYFTSSGAAQGDTILAVNTLILQLFTIFSYIMDGFAHAGEAMTGKYYGAGNKKLLKKTISQLFGWGITLSMFFTLLYAIGGESFLKLLTNDTEVLNTAQEYFFWALIIPLAGFSAFLYDGIFIGLTATNLMLKAMFVASATFFAIHYSLEPFLGNHSLWLAFITYLLFRGITQWYLGRKIIR